MDVNLSPAQMQQVTAIMAATGGRGKAALKSSVLDANPQNLSLFGAGFDAATASGMAYLMGQLEKIDPKLYEPLTSTTWQRDITAKTGGGWVEYTSTFANNYGISGPNEDGLMHGSATAIPVIQADIVKDTYPVFTWANILRVPLVDQAKLEQIGRSLEGILQEGLQLNSQKTLDKNVYVGFADRGTTGLINDPNIVQGLAENNEAGTSRLWRDKTPDEILHDINQALIAAWAASEYDVGKGMPNQILIPPGAYAYLVSQKVSLAADKSILQYLLENNIARQQGVQVSIQPCRWCVGAGVGDVGRMVVYVNKESNVYFDLTVPLTRALTSPSVEQMAYLTAYVMQFGVVKFMYTQPARYVDGIWEGV